MGKIAVHEMGYPFDPRLGEAIGAIMGASEALLQGRRTLARSEAYESGVLHLTYAQASS